MVTPSYKITCTKNELIADGVYDVRFKRPTDFKFIAGQFLLLDVPLVEDPSDIQPRAYSIASTPEESEIILVIKILPGGRTSCWVEEVAAPGTEIVMKGPFGVFKLNKETPKDYLFICTCTGNAPFRSMIKDALEHGENRPMDLVFGCRHNKDLFLVEEFEALAIKYPNFKFHVALTKPDAGWEGLTGRVNTVTPEVIKDISSKHVYVCGNPAMTKTIKELCLNDWGVPKEDFHMEGFI